MTSNNKNVLNVKTESKEEKDAYVKANKKPVVDSTPFDISAIVASGLVTRVKSKGNTSSLVDPRLPRFMPTRNVDRFFSYNDSTYEDWDQLQAAVLASEVNLIINTYDLLSHVPLLAILGLYAGKMRCVSIDQAIQTVIINKVTEYCASVDMPSETVRQLVTACQKMQSFDALRFPNPQRVYGYDLPVSGVVNITRLPLSKGGENRYNATETKYIETNNLQDLPETDSGKYKGYAQFKG